MLRSLVKPVDKVGTIPGSPTSQTDEGEEPMTILNTDNPRTGDDDAVNGVTTIVESKNASPRYHRGHFHVVSLELP